MKVFDRIFKQDRSNPALCRTAAGHDFLRVIGAQAIPNVTPPHTSILYQCTRCLLHLSHCIQGEWTLADLRRTEKEIEELASLERLGTL